MEILTIFAAVTPLEWVLGIVATLVSALLVGVGTLLWRMTGKVQELSLQVTYLAEEVKELKIIVEGGRKWRWDRTPLPRPDDN